MNDFYEFFAGGGMVRAGLGEEWRCRFANDFDQRKAAVYRANWDDDVLRIADIRTIGAEDLPGAADLAWASFPCQDLSLAGPRIGLAGERSRNFWAFWSLMRRLASERRAPLIVALENVCGTLVSNNGRDFAAICKAFQDIGYRFGAVVVDAALFVPQSRARLFAIAVRKNVRVPDRMIGLRPSPLWHIHGVQSAYAKLSHEIRRDWIWWSLPTPKPRLTLLADVVEHEASDVEWHTAGETASLLAMMSKHNRAKIERAKAAKRLIVGAAFKRTRSSPDGARMQRAECRFDNVAGCLRPPVGGSSRQLIIIIHGDSVRSRLISARETARLMGLPDTYRLPDNRNEAYQLTGDGVVAPVVRHLAHYLFEPLVTRAKARRDETAARSASDPNELRGRGPKPPG